LKKIEAALEERREGRGGEGSQGVDADRRALGVPRSGLEMISAEKA
jgi:hypothetical protein